MKKWFNYFIYISILFLVIALIKADYFVIPHIEKPFCLIIAFICVFAGFFVDAAAWKESLSLYGFRNIKYSDSVKSVGLSIFGKYVPGKIWVIIGRSAFIAKRYDLDEKVIASVSVNAQFISLWCALFTGIIGLFFIKAQLYLILLSVALLLFFSLILFTKIFHRLFTLSFNKIFKKHFEVPQLNYKAVIHIMPFYLLCWLTWCAGFWLLTLALSPQFIPPYIGLSFALGASLGMIAVILPGGLGLREGLLALFLVAVGLSEQTAVTVSVSSRLWYLTGECFIFVIALLLSGYRKFKKG